MRKEKLVTLKTNHTILAQITEDFDMVFLKEPVQVVMQQSAQGPMLAFAPFLEYCEEFNSGIPISKNDVLCITTPSTELANQYNQVFGSGIQIASAIPKV